VLARPGGWGQRKTRRDAIVITCPVGSVLARDCRHVHRPRRDHASGRRAGCRRPHGPERDLLQDVCETIQRQYTLSIAPQGGPWTLDSALAYAVVHAVLRETPGVEGGLWREHETDEVGDMSLLLQAKLLRVLQERKIADSPGFSGKSLIH